MSLLLPQKIQDGFQAGLSPLIGFLTRFKVNPNWFTTAGFILNILAALVFVAGGKFGDRLDLQYLGWGGCLVLLGGLCDMIDGKVARASGQTTRFGALYDSVLDRYSEVVMFLGMGYYLVAQNYYYESVFCFVALGGARMGS